MSTYMVYHINKIMDKNLLILSIEAKIVFDKINQFMKEIKSSQQWVYRGNAPQLNKCLM